MGIFKDLFNNLEFLLFEIGNFDYSRLIMLVLGFFVAYSVHSLILKNVWRKRINETTIDFKKVNLEATFLSKKRKLKQIYLFSGLFLAFLFIMKDDLHIVVPILSALIVVFIISLGAQLNNIFLGIMFKSSISTTNYEGMIFYFKDQPNEICKIVKINLFKTVYKNEKNGKLYSIENKELNSQTIIHKPLQSLDYVEFTYMVDDKFPLDKYIKELKNILNKEIDNINIDYKELKESIHSLRSTYSSAPFLKPSYGIDVKYKQKDEIEIKIYLTTYKYNFKKYTDDFLKFQPKNG